MITAMFLIVLFYIIETCLQMPLLFYQMECLPTREVCRYCKFVKNSNNKKTLHHKTEISMALPL